MIPLFQHYNDINILSHNLSSDLNSLNEWSAQNKMFINTKKTKSMLVTGKRIPNKVESGVDLSLQFSIGGVLINSVNSQKLLGVFLDTDMSHENHIDELSKKISKRLGLLKHISPYLKQSQREMYYSTVVKPSLMHGSMA